MNCYLGFVQCPKLSNSFAFHLPAIIPTEASALEKLSHWTFVSGTLSHQCSLFSFFLPRCQWMRHWLPSLRPQFRVCQLGGKLQVWMPQRLWVCRWPAHLCLWVPESPFPSARRLLNPTLWLIHWRLVSTCYTEALTCGFSQVFSPLL